MSVKVRYKNHMIMSFRIVNVLTILQVTFMGEVLRSNPEKFEVKLVKMVPDREMHNAN